MTRARRRSDLRTVAHGTAVARMSAVENEFGVDVQEVLDLIGSAEVFVIMFQHFERRLLVDSRTAGSEGPLIRVVDRVRNADERFRDLRRLRPRFPAPERIVAFQWPRSVKTLVSSGVWQAIEDRLKTTGGSEWTCHAVLAELEREELNEEHKAIRGDEPWRTLWANSA
jgi:hypothetical protein